MLPTILSHIPIKYASIPDNLEGVTARGVLWQVAAESFLLEVPSVARYLVEAGQSITIDPVPTADAEIIGHFLRMAPMAALLYQQGMCALHASAVVKDSGAVLLAGDSGTGKSTLLKLLLQHGWKMLADDLSIIGLDEIGQAVVYPSFPEIALWPDAIRNMEIDSEILQPFDINRKKLLIADQFEITPQPLQKIYWLSVHSRKGCVVEELAGSDRFRAIGVLSYNSHIADALSDKITHLRYAAAIAQSVSISRLRRPHGEWSANALTDIIDEKY